MTQVTHEGSWQTAQPNKYQLGPKLKLRGAKKLKTFLEKLSNSMLIRLITTQVIQILKIKEYIAQKIA